MGLGTITTAVELARGRTDPDAFALLMECFRDTFEIVCAPFLVDIHDTFATARVREELGQGGHRPKMQWALHHSHGWAQAHYNESRESGLSKKDRARARQVVIENLMPHWFGALKDAIAEAEVAMPRVFPGRGPCYCSLCAGTGGPYCACGAESVRLVLDSSGNQCAVRCEEDHPEAVGAIVAGPENGLVTVQIDPQAPPPAPCWSRGHRLQLPLMATLVKPQT